MMEQKKSKILSGINIYKIENVALIEWRSFKNSWRDEIIHIDLNFLISLNLSSFPPDISRYSDSDPTNKEKIYLNLDEIFLFMEESEYNTVLVELFVKCETFDQANSVIPYIHKANNLNVDQVKKVAEHCLESNVIRNSFQVQRTLLSFIVKNKYTLDRTTFSKLITDFPHRHSL
jgi:hypothetical protein